MFLQAPLLRQELMDKMYQLYLTKPTWANVSMGINGIGNLDVSDFFVHFLTRLRLIGTRPLALFR
jgi:hypothetical protein